MLCAGTAQAGAAGCPAPPAGTPLPAEAIATPKDDAAWRDHVAALSRTVAADDLTTVQTVFIGDSITEGWAPPVFTQFYGSRGPLNLGVRGDTTQSLLWRLAQLPAFPAPGPRLVVLLIGTNDLWPGASASQVATGIATVLGMVRTRLPHTRILLVGLLPRGQAPDDPLRALVTQVNAAIRPCADGQAVVYADPGSMLLDGTGHLSSQTAFDYLHPTWIGYAILAAALEPDIRRMLAQDRVAGTATN